MSVGGGVMGVMETFTLSPQRLAGLDEFRGLSGRKAEWLRSLAGPPWTASSTPPGCVPCRTRTLSENWRPYRTWVTLLLRAQLEYETGEITGRPEPA